MKTFSLCTLTIHLSWALTALMLCPLLSAHAAIATLKWKDHCPNEQGFKIERSSSASGPWTQVTTVGPNVTVYNDNTLPDGATYYYRVRAYKGTWNSAYTNVSKKTAVPVPPIGLTAKAGAAGTKKIALTWSSSSGATGYQVFRATAWGGTYTLIGTTTTVTSFTNTGLTAGSTYWYRVTATNAGGASAQTAFVSAKAL